MAEPLDIDDMRQTLARVSIYRQVCEQVRAGAGHTFFNGALFLGLAFVNYRMIGGFHPILLGPIIIGSAEVLVAIWKRLRPSPECVLLDALLQVAFVLSIVGREGWFFLQFNQPPSAISVFIGLWVAYDAYNTFGYYLSLRRVFVERPSAEHLAYVDDLTYEVANGDPHTDPAVVDIPTKPHLKAKLLGDVAFFFDFRSRELFVCTRDEMALTRYGGGSEGVLTILQQQFPPCPLDSATWNNYAAWRSAGGDRA